VISDLDRFYAAAPYTFLVASLIVLLFGTGKFAVDTWLFTSGAPNRAAWSQ